MCLDRQSIKPKQLATYKARVGWKVFEYAHGKLHFKFNALNGTKIVPINEWLTSPVNYTIRDNHDKQYRPRFHIYLTKPKPTRYTQIGETIVRVKFKDAGITGYQGSNLPTVVAKYMFVPKQREKKI